MLSIFIDMRLSGAAQNGHEVAATTGSTYTMSNLITASVSSIVVAVLIVLIAYLTARSIR